MKPTNSLLYRAGLRVLLRGFLPEDYFEDGEGHPGEDDGVNGHRDDISKDFTVRARRRNGPCVDQVLVEDLKGSRYNHDGDVGHCVSEGSLTRRRVELGGGVALCKRIGDLGDR